MNASEETFEYELWGNHPECDRGWSAGYRQPPRWWMLGLWLSGIWIVAYCLIYPSLPLPGGHWQGLGIPGRGQWTAIKELADAEAELRQVRGVYQDKMLALDVAQLAEDRDLQDYATRAGYVRFGDDCAACHGKLGAALPAIIPPTLNDAVWLHGGSVPDILASIKSRSVHPHVGGEMSEGDARVLALYVYQLSGSSD